MKHSVRRLIAILMTVWMVLSLLPAQAAEIAGQDDYTRKCPICGAGTSEGWDPDGSACKAPTCTAKGKVGGVCIACMRAGRIPVTTTGFFTRSVPALGHDWGKWTVVKESTCSVKGSHKHTCKRCGKTATEDMDLKPHTWGEWTVLTEAADFIPGLREHTCGKCGKSAQEEYYPEGTLMTGDKGDAVKALQEALNANGNDCGKADGAYGKKTAKAVAEFEAVWGLTADGIAWPGVQALLFGGGIGGDDEPADYTFTKTTLDVELEPRDTFREGEEINWFFRVTNALSGPDDAYCMRNVVITDPDLDHVSELGDIPYGGAAETRIIDDIDANDAVRGYIDNTAAVTWLGPDDEVHSMDAQCHVTVLDGNIIFRQSVLSDPDNGEYYTEGEKVTFGFTLTNHREIAPEDAEIYTGPDMLDVQFFDELAPGDEGAQWRFAAFPVIGSNGTEEASFTYTVTAEDVERGYIDSTAWMEWMPAVKDPDSFSPTMRNSNTVRVWTIPEALRGISLKMRILSEPKDGSYYREGEIIRYEIALRNGSESTLNDVTVSDPLAGEGADAVLLIAKTLEPGSEQVCFFEYTVTPDDTQEGIVRNTATASWGERTMRSNEELAGTKRYEGEPGDPEDPDGISLDFSITSDPDNGEFYVRNELVSYRLVVKNVGHKAITVNDFFDPDTNEMFPIWNIEIGYETSSDIVMTFDRQVSEEDVTAGEMKTQSRQEIDGTLYLSQILSAPTGESKPDPKGPTGPEKDAEEPEDPTGPEKGWVEPKDPTKPEDDPAKPKDDPIKPDDDPIKPDDDPIKPDDDPVKPDDDPAKPDNDPVKPKDDPAKPEKDTGKTPGGKTPAADPVGHCTLSVRMRGDDYTEYEILFCARHGGTQKAADLIVASAAEETLAQAWEQAAALWKDETDAMYDAMAENADETLRAAIRDEQTLFTARVTSEEALLKALRPEDPAGVAEEIAGIYREKCAALCCETDTVPGTDAGDPAEIPYEVSFGEHRDACGTEVLSADETGLRYRDLYCTDHAAILKFMNSLHGDSRNSTKTWRKIGQMWRNDFANGRRSIMSGNNAAAAALAEQDLAAFEAWIEARETLLKLMYPDREAAVLQIVAEEAMKRATK